MKWNQISDKLQGFGKDRFLLLFLAGLMLIVIAMPMEKMGGADQNSSEKVTDTKNGQEVKGKSTLAVREGMEPQSDVENYRMQLCAQLKDFLQKMEGVGQAEVYITMHSSAEIIVERNSPYTRRNEEEVQDENKRSVTETENASEVVLMECEDGSQTPIVVKEITPVVRGVVIAVQGADNVQVKNEITQLVMALFGIEEHKIRVVKRTV